jgi:hypothetical protein
MKDALIGYTGFVGSNIQAQYQFDSLYNSKNFNSMADKSFDFVICAGISAVKWLANKNPQEDIDNIKKLQNILSTIHTKKFILISTIDVYPTTQSQDETFNCYGLDNHAYGVHRLEFENFCKKQFAECFIIRLPAIFGNGIKKNIIYDLLHDNCLEMINIRSSFQYYDLSNIWADIQKTILADIRLINFFTEPIITQDIINTFFPNIKVGSKAIDELHYDLHSIHAKLWGNLNYLYTKDKVIEQIGNFIEQYNTNSKFLK